MQKVGHGVANRPLVELIGGAISASMLKIHMPVHSGEKPFACKQCNFSFTQAGALKRHMLNHARKKPFSCTQCSYSCIQAGYLKSHMLAHSGEKPFKCTQCNSNGTYTPIQERSLSGVTSATILALHLVI